MNKISPREIAKKLGVSHVSVYRWIKNGKLKSTRHDDGPVVQYTVTEGDFDQFLAVFESKVLARKNRHVNVNATDRQSAWVARYRQVFGSLPPEYLAFKKGAITFEAMRGELERRVNLASELMFTGEL